MSYDNWLTNDFRAEQGAVMHELFENSEAYVDAYADYCDNFTSSASYDRAYHQWLDTFNDDSDDDHPDFDPTEADMLEDDDDVFNHHNYD